MINEAETEDKKLTVTDIKNRAVAFAKENGNPTFNPSKGWILRFLQRHGKKLPEKNKNSKGEEVRTRNQFSLAEKHEVAKYIVENQNVLAKDVAVIFTEKFAKPLTADTVRRIKSEGIYQKLKLAFPRSGPEYTWTKNLMYQVYNVSSRFYPKPDSTTEVQWALYQCHQTYVVGNNFETPTQPI